MKYLCFDYGQKRTGVAASAPDGALVLPLAAILCDRRKALLDAAQALLAVEKAEALVVGLPLRRDGSEGLTARQARNFGRSLQRRSGLPLFYMDESYSSAEAEDLLKNSNQRFRTGDGRVDSLAAAVILESFLRELNNKGTALP